MSPRHGVGRVCRGRSLSALLAAVALAGGCRGVLGIDDLDGATGSSESATNEGGAGGAGGGKAGAGGAGRAGGAPGKAGAGGGAVGKAGAGGVSPPPADPLKACQQSCVGAAPPGIVDRYYDAVAGCACGDDKDADDDKHDEGCGWACGPSCDLGGGAFGAASSTCVACVAERGRSGRCKDEAKNCTGPCETLSACLEQCTPD